MSPQAARPIISNRWAGLILALIVSIECQSAQAAKLPPSDFRYHIPLMGEAASKQAAQIVLPATMVSQTADGFADLRIFDNEGLEVPYAIRQEKGIEHPGTFAFEATGFEEKERVDVFTLERPKTAGLFESLEIVTSETNFKKRVTIQASEDGSTWRDAGGGSIYDYSSRVHLRRNRIQFAATGSRYLRVQLENEAPATADEAGISLQYKDLVFQTSDKKGKAFRIDRFLGHHETDQPENRVEECTTLSIITASLDADGNTIIDLGYAGLPFHTARLDVEDSFFYRTAEIWESDTGEDQSFRRSSAATICRVPQLPEPVLDLGHHPAKSHYVRIKILNEDNPPLSIRKVDLLWLRLSLCFFPESGKTYAGYYGNQEASHPRYETQALIQSRDFRLLPMTQWRLGPLTENPDYHPGMTTAEREKIQRMVLTGFVILLAGVLGAWAVTMVKKMSAGGEPGGTA